MHEIYFEIWNLAMKINKAIKFKKISIFLFISTLLWTILGALIYLIISLFPVMRLSLVDMFVTAGYSGVIMGFFGAALYILRNTEPGEL